MRPTLHPRLVNGRYGDPAVYVEALHRSEALLFDLGDLAALAARDLLRIGLVCVSHMHIDHFIGFDRLLRVNVGRDREIALIGPEGLSAAVGHKLQAYTWDLAERYTTDLVFAVSEVLADGGLRTTRFSLQQRFAARPAEPPRHSPGPVIHLGDYDLSVAVLDHHGPSLGFAVQEPLHVNVWRNRLEQSGLEPGPWLQPLKRAIAAGAATDTPIALPSGEERPLSALADLVSTEPGQKVAYVTDVVDTPLNRARIEELAQGADMLLIDATFAAEDAELAKERAHLTTRAAGEIARAAGVRRVEPFHFSPRYKTEEARMLAQVADAFGRSAAQAT